MIGFDLPRNCPEARKRHADPDAGLLEQIEASEQHNRPDQEMADRHISQALSDQLRIGERLGMVDAVPYMHDISSS